MDLFASGDGGFDEDMDLTTFFGAFLAFFSLFVVFSLNPFFSARRVRCHCSSRCQWRIQLVLGRGAQLAARWPFCGFAESRRHLLSQQSRRFAVYDARDAPRHVQSEPR